MIDVKELPAAEKATLLKELLKEEEQKQEIVKEERRVYKETANILIAETMKELQNISSMLSKAKGNVFNNFAALLSMKKELFGYKDGQQSHSFTNSFGQTIEIGCRTIDGWDDTVEAGVAKVNHYIDSLATSDETAKLVKFIQNLLKKDAKGNLKANRVLELQNLSESIADEMFADGVKIIQEAYNPVKSAYFIEARYKDETGKNTNIPLSITAAKFPEGVEIDVESL